MSAKKIPQTDSVKEIAEFWDTHEATDFGDELAVVEEPVFSRSGELTVCLDPDEIRKIVKLAEAKGLSNSELVHEWVKDKLKAA